MSEAEILRSAWYIMLFNFNIIFNPAYAVTFKYLLQFVLLLDGENVWNNSELTSVYSKTAAPQAHGKNFPLSP